MASSEQTGTSQPESTPDHPSGSGGVRWRLALVLLTVCGAGTMVVNQLAPDRTFRVIWLSYCVLGSVVVMLVWWTLLSGLSWKIRVGGLAGLGLLAGGLILSIGGIHFDGAMVPRIRWVWQPSVDDQRTQWAGQQDPEGVSDPSLDAPLVITDEDWPRFCGADGSRVIREPLTVRDWEAHPPRQVWRHPIWDAWSSFAVVGPRLFTQEQRDDMECVVCYHAATGVELWVHQTSTRYATAMGGIGPRATPTVTETGLFALGANGRLSCLNPVTGAEIWQRQLTEDAQTDIPQWGYSGSPLVRGNTVIVVAGGNKGVMACDRKTGDIVWATGEHRAGYTSPRIDVIHGEEVLLAFHGDGLAALKPDDGTPLWSYPFTNMYHVNVAQPIVVDGNVFIGTGYDGGCVCLDPSQVADGQPAEVFAPNRNLKLKFNEAVLHDGYIYGLDDGILCCLDPQTGRRRWKGGRYRHGQVLLWDDMLLVQAEKGYVVLVNASPEKFEEVTRFEGLSRPTEGGETRAWNVPVVNRNHLYLRNDREAACYELPRNAP